MLHLFNKVYVEFDNKINVNIDRVVISEQYGIPMSNEFEKYTYGQLVRFAKNLQELNSAITFDEFILELKSHSERTNKKLIVYCDRTNYIRFMASWFKLMMPALDYETYKTLAILTIYKERCVSNTQLSSQNTVNVGPIFNEFTEEDWQDGWNNKILGQISPALMGVSISYEFLLANYLAGDTHYTEELLKTSHLFLRRFFQECFTDNRQMVSLNINNHRMQQVLGYEDVELDYSNDPLKQIPFFSYYTDPIIWKAPTTLSSGLYGICNLQGLDQDRIDGLKHTILDVYEKFEGMITNTTIFESFDWLEIACRDSMTIEELDEIIEKVSAAPFDTCLIPRMDYENVNFPLYLHILRSHHEGNIDHLQKMIIHSVE
jgi:hypothetical protein